MPPRADLSFVGLNNHIFKSKVSETITNVPKIETNASKTSRDSLEKPKTVRFSAPLIEEWESDSEDENVFKPKEVKKTVKPSFEKIEFVNARNTTVKNESKAIKPKKFSQSPRGSRDFDSGCSIHIIGNKSYLIDYQEIDGGFVAFGGNAKGGIENQIDHKVETIRCDNETEFKNRIINEFYEMKGIRREFSVPRTPQQNDVAERKNRTLMKETRLKLHETIWVSCYYPKYLRSPRTRFIEENLHINFLDNKPNVAGTGPNWMFDIDTLTMSMSYQPLFVGNQTNGNAGLKSLEDEVADDAGKKSTKIPREKNGVQDPAKQGDKNGQKKVIRDRLFGQGEDANTNSTNRLNIISSFVNVVSSSFTTVDPGRERA
uniref:Ribonuclease H-like domain-containing protein n=1 Tax=Tanacetum cinerariifolium TaxID=118510 RepID=A0A6L2JCB0_TANCI|nr:ribonuclease H-like domain-containing protein [Tanacetum cinerariifolium]